MMIPILIWLILGMAITILYFINQGSITVRDMVQSPIMIVFWPLIASSMLFDFYEDYKDKVLWRHK